MKLDMGIPVINLEGLNGEKRAETMALLHEACEKWGFFQVANHGINEALIEKLKGLVNLHCEECMKESFYKSETAKAFLKRAQLRVMPQMWIGNAASLCATSLPPTSMSSQVLHMNSAMEEYINQVIKLAERLLELMSENLGLAKDYLKKQLLGEKGDLSVGTKVAKYPQYTLPELVNGLRAHTVAGGVILLLQDDQIPGLQVLKDGEWVDITTAPYSEGKSTICINTADQIEVMSNGTYKSTLHRVLVNKEGSRLSIATFYNPAADALISPAPDLLYPNRFRFQDHLGLYAISKFADKGPRFHAMKKMSLSGPSFFV